MIPLAVLPTYDPAEQAARDGFGIALPSFCRERLAGNDKQCVAHYRALAGGTEQFRMCPYGFTSYPVKLEQATVIITGIVATPRFDDAKERARAKQFPEVRVSRDSVLSVASFYKRLEESIRRIEEGARRRLPQALHELRKLNAIVKANVEKLGGDDAVSAEVKSISGAAQIMSNIFDVVEALANIEGLKALKHDDFIAVFDLAFKAKKLYEVRAKMRPINIYVSGDDRLAIYGSKKTFPIVLTVLLENAIKYGRPSSTINIVVSKVGVNCSLEVSNESDVPIDPARCFDRGVRFGDEAVEGDGLGLYLVREIVNCHNGSVDCSVNGGTVSMKVLVPAHIEQRGRR